ncbi:hypothetical protein MMC22_002729 [Lobaria immixta]|nr:hypothetical protein [Lobaria immixta]
MNVQSTRSYAYYSIKAKSWGFSAGSTACKAYDVGGVDPAPGHKADWLSVSFPSFRLKSDKDSQRLSAHSNESSQISLNQGALPTSQDPSTSQGLGVLSATSAEPQSHGVEDTQSSSSIPSESPLRRPLESNVDPVPVEGPLQRPFDDREGIAFCDITATFAVDVSGSTAGKVLEEEKDAICSLCIGLSRDAQPQAEIIPWNHTTQRIIHSSELDGLCSFGGTIPNSLTTSFEAKKALSKCSAWFLLTDGEIAHNEICDFSNGICEASLHGTPCVVILFGYKSLRPTMCNISVGLSVFSNATDCLFLFHDIDTTQVYILQSKGKFNALLPSGCREVVFNEETLWTDLPTFLYRQLFDLPIPLRQKLRPDDLLLQGGQKINLQNLYLNQVDPSVTRDIMENDENLKSVLLAAQLRGKDDDIENWISNQKLEASNILLCDRPDANNQATMLIRALLHAVSLEHPDHLIVDSLQKELRTAHFANWGLFLSSLGAQNDLTSARSTVISDAMARISTNRREIESTSSPIMLSPVTPIQSLFHQPEIDMDWTTTSYLPSRPKPHHAQLSGKAFITATRNHVDLKASSRCTNIWDLTQLKLRLGEDMGALYINGYKYQEGYSNVGFMEICPICHQQDVLLTALIKAPPKGLSTPGFPSPGERKGLVYPLAMGSYPETDVLSSHVCCDSCAYILIRGKICLDHDEITAAIPLMPAAFAGNYKRTTFNLLDKALQERFHSSAVLLVFLSTVYDTLANIEGDYFELRSRALKQMARWLSENAALPTDLSMSITGSTPRSGTFGDPQPLTYVIQQNIRRIHEPESPLLQYPIGGFVILTLIANDLDLISSQKLCQLAVWNRFLYHLVEKHCALIAIDQAQAVAALEAIVHHSRHDLSGTDTDLERPHKRSTAPANSLTAGTPQAEHRISPATLCGTHLLFDEELEEFQRLDDLFKPAEEYSSSVLEIFLRRLSEEMPKAVFAIHVFDTMRALEDLRPVFDIPRQLNVIDKRRGANRRSNVRIGKFGQDKAI